MAFRSLAQQIGKPQQTDQRDKLTGDEYCVTGAIEVEGAPVGSVPDPGIGLPVVSAGFVTQTIPNATLTPVFCSISNNEGGAFSQESGYSLTALQTGMIMVVAQAWFVSNATGFRKIELTVGGFDVAQDGRAALATPHETIPRIVQFERVITAGDLISLLAWQDSGGPLDIRTGALQVTLLRAFSF